VSKSKKLRRFDQLLEPQDPLGVAAQDSSPVSLGQ
jgi:hypothetical protein